MSSILTEKFNFQTSQEIYSFILISFIIAYFLFCGNFAMFGCADCMEAVEDTDNEVIIIKN